MQTDPTTMNPQPPPLPPRYRRSHSGAGIALVVIASVLLLLAAGLLAGGSVLMWADRSQRDTAGYLTSPTGSVAVPGYALATTNIAVALGDPGWHVAADALGSARITATAGQGTAIFIGIAPSSDVTAYLNGVAYDEPTGFISERGLTYRAHQGGPPATPPASQTFWQAQVSGQGTQTLTWQVASGQWAIVLMNADASSGVFAEVSVGATAPFLFGLALGLLIGGGVALVVAAVLLFFGVRLLRGTPQAPPPGTVALSGTAHSPVLGQTGSAHPVRFQGHDAPAYPLRFEGHLDARVSRGLWLVKWLLLIPHFVVLAALFVVSFILTIVAFFAILLTGRYPRSIFDFNVGVLRWWWRVSFYGYSALATDWYPPFSLSALTPYPATLDVPYPDRLSRGLVLVKWWLLAIPHYVIVGILVGGSGTGLITILAFFGAIALLFTGRYPADIFTLVMGLNRWAFRVLVYAMLMRDEYPPFRLDPGPSDAGPVPAAPPAAPGALLPRPYGA